MELFHSHIHPDGVEITYDCEGEFIAEYDDDNTSTCSNFGLISISHCGVQLPAFGTSKDWREFLAVVEDSARRAVEFEAVNVEIRDRVGNADIIVHDKIEVK